MCQSVVELKPKKKKENLVHSLSSPPDLGVNFTLSS